jgi:hypothetical protein
LKELLRSNDVVHLSWIKSVFDEANIPIFVMDEQMSVFQYFHYTVYAGLLDLPLLQKV